MSRICGWCKITRSWRSRLLRLCGYCKVCHSRACCEAGIYLQNGGPPFPGGSRLGEQE